MGQYKRINKKKPLPQHYTRLKKRRGITGRSESLLDSNFLDQFLQYLGAYPFYREKIFSLLEFTMIFPVLNNRSRFFIANPGQLSQRCLVRRVDINGSQGHIDGELERD